MNKKIQKTNKIKSIMAKSRSRFKFLKKKSHHPSAHPECKFCKKLIDNEDVWFENQHIVVMPGRPHHKGHLVVLPKAHEENLMKLHEKTLDAFLNDTIKVMKALDKAIKPEMFNLEYLDNWDHHVHWNIYPRFKTDKDFGNPPVIPKKGKRFKKMELSEGELKIFKQALKRLSKSMW